MDQHNKAPFRVARPLSRREFLRRTSVLGIAAMTPQLLAACGSTGGQIGGGNGEVGGELNFLSWEGYDMRKATSAWRKQQNIDLKSAYIGTADDIPSRVLGPGGDGIDVVTYFYGHGPQWLDQGVLGEFKREEVPNIEDLFPEFQESKWWQTESGDYTGVPFTWLSWPLSYRPDLVDAPTKWADLLEDEFSGRVAWVDDPVAVITTVAVVLGFEPDEMTSDQLDKVKDWLLRLRKNTKTVAPSYGDLLNLLVSGEAVAAVPGWQAFNVWGKEQGAEIDFVIPEDGYGMSIDIYTVATTTDSRTTALAWLNEMISPKVQTAVADTLYTGVTNAKALDSLAEDIRALYPYNEIGSALSAERLYEVPWRDSNEYVVYKDWLRVWNEVKSAD